MAVKSKWLNLRCLIGVWILLAFVLSQGFNGQTQSFLIHNPQTYIKTLQELLEFANNEKNVKITYYKYAPVKMILEIHYGKKWPFNELLKKLQHESSWSNLAIAMNVYNKSIIYISNFKYLQDILSNYNEFPLAISDELKLETLTGGNFIVNKLNDGTFCQNATHLEKKYHCVKGIIDRENRSLIRSKIIKM